MLVLVTPAEYEPPGFKACESDNFKFDEEPMNIKIGDVNTVGLVRDASLKICNID